MAPSSRTALHVSSCSAAPSASEAVACIAGWGGSWGPKPASFLILAVASFSDEASFSDVVVQQ